MVRRLTFVGFLSLFLFACEGGTFRVECKDAPNPLECERAFANEQEYSLDLEEEEDALEVNGQVSEEIDQHQADDAQEVVEQDQECEANPQNVKISDSDPCALENSNANQNEDNNVPSTTYPKRYPENYQDPRTSDSYKKPVF